MKWLKVIVVLVLLLMVAGWAKARFLYEAFSARVAPGPVETWAGRSLRSLAMPPSVKTARNPVEATPENLREARIHFAEHCAMCHSNDGSGAVWLGQSLAPSTPDLRKEPTQKLSDGELFYIIENGVRFTGMPAFGEPGNEADSWKLVHFIRRLSQLTPEELAEMRKYNPRSAADSEEGYDSSPKQPDRPSGGRHQHGKQ